MPRLRSLRHRVLLLFAILALGPLLALGLLDYLHARRSVERIIESRTDAGAKRAVEVILDRYAVLQSDALLLTDNPQTQELFSALAQGDPARIAAAHAAADTFARTFWVNASASYRMIELRDSHGTTLIRLPDDSQATTSPASDSVAGHRRSQAAIDSERTASAADDAMPGIEFPVRPAGTGPEVGLLVLHPHSVAIVPAQLRGLGFGATGYLIVVDSTHRVLYDSRIGQSSMSSAMTLGADDVPLAALTGGADGTAVHYATGDSTRLATAESVPALGWTVVSSAALAEFTGGLDSARILDLALVVAITIGVAIAFTILVGRTTRSLEELTVAAKAVGQGDLAPPLPPESDDEIGTLSHAFAQMLGRLRAMMQEIEVSRQLAVLGEFSAQLSHEIRNPLTSLQLNLQGLARDVHRGILPADAGPPLDTCLREVKRLDGVVHSVLELARPRPSARVTLDLNSVLDRVIDVHARRLDDAGIAVIREHEAARNAVQGEPEQLVGLFTNLIVNAIDAQPHGGRLLLRTRSNGSRIKIVIADDGPGIPADLAETIFRPFVSGKPTGTGLGLPMALNVARDHRGTLELTSPPEGFRGAAFRVTLPLA